METSRRPGPDSTLVEVREQLIDAATDSLLAVGIEVGLEQVKLSNVIVRAGVTRATAYRSLADDRLSPQDKLRQEVLTRLLARDSRQENRDLVNDAAAGVLAERGDDLASDDIAVRTDVLRSLIRAGTKASHDGITASVERGILMASYGALMSQGSNGTRWQLEKLRIGEQALLATFSEIYRGLIAVFQIQLRPGLTLAHFSTIVAALAEGLGMRGIVNDHVEGIDLPVGPGGATESWTLQGLGLTALVKGFFEPADPKNPMVDLSLL